MLALLTVPSESLFYRKIDVNIDQLASFQSLYVTHAWRYSRFGFEKVQQHCARTVYTWASMSYFGFQAECLHWDAGR